jgi:protein-S-isoprenylcysteine O-methyltransferase Ste14
MGLKNIWIDFLYKSATGSKKIRTILTPIGAIIFGLFTCIFIIVAIQIDDLLNLPRIIITPSNLFVSVPLIFIGIILTGWSIGHFLKVKGTPVPLNPPPILVNTGPYAYARNPMLTGIFLLLFGIGFLIESFSLIFIFTPLFIVVNALELKKIEEPELEKRLGQKYIDYKKKTPMFIPGITKTNKRIVCFIKKLR